MGNGYKSNDGDMCIYSKTIRDLSVIINLYVDDMLIFRTNIDCVNDTKKFISSIFDMKDLGVAKMILGIKIVRSDNGIVIT